MSSIHARGWLYFLIGALGIVVERTTAWIVKEPENLWAYVATVASAVLTGLIAVRAYMDQHISIKKGEGVKDDKTQEAQT